MMKENFRVQAGARENEQSYPELPEEVSEECGRAAKALRIYELNPLIFRAGKDAPWQLLFCYEEGERLTRVVRIFNDSLTFAGLTSEDSKTYSLGIFPSRDNLILVVAHDGRIFQPKDPGYFAGLQLLWKMLEASAQLNKLIEK